MELETIQLSIGCPQDGSPSSPQVFAVEIYIRLAISYDRTDEVAVRPSTADSSHQSSWTRPRRLFKLKIPPQSVARTSLEGKSCAFTCGRYGLLELCQQQKASRLLTSSGMALSNKTRTMLCLSKNPELLGYL